VTATRFQVIFLKNRLSLPADGFTALAPIAARPREPYCGEGSVMPTLGNCDACRLAVIISCPGRGVAAPLTGGIGRRFGCIES
jgi:hypothetical protein